jgi:DNA-binding transcriptional MerR regulator
MLKNNMQSSAIPDKLYFTIGEVAKLCEVKTHVLRYWEQEFVQLDPVKRKGNRRYYQRKDVILIRQIKKLLYERGFTIEGAKAQILQIEDEPKVNVVEKAKLLQAISDLENLIVELEKT